MRPNTILPNLISVLPRRRSVQVAARVENLPVRLCRLAEQLQAHCSACRNKSTEQPRRVLRRPPAPARGSFPSRAISTTAGAQEIRGVSDLPAQTELPILAIAGSVPFHLAVP